MSRMTRSCLGITGLIIILLGAKVFYANYKPNNLDMYYILAMCSVFIALGFEFIIIIFDIKNPVIKSILLIFLGAFIVLNFYNEYIRTGSILLILAILIFLIIAFTKNIFSTLVTFTLLSIPFFLCLIILLQMLPLYGNIIFYLVITTFFIFYRMIGVKANKFFIGKFMGFNYEAQMYDVVQLKEQINFIYLLIFILMNIENWFLNSNVNVATILNNAFITGVAITNINWNNIFWFVKSK